VHTRKVYELPLASSGARGKALVNFLNLAKDETVTRVLPVPSDKTTWANLVALFATAKGIIRKTPLTAFNNVNSSGIKGISIDEGDSLVNVAITGEKEGDVLLSSREGKAVRFSVESLRTIASRSAYGVRGMELRDGDSLVSMDVITAAKPYVLTVTENGYGKRTTAEDFPAKSRGTLGVIAIQTTDCNGNVVASLPVGDGDEVILVTNDGQVIRTRADDISVIGRNTQGVTLFKVEGKTKVTSACVIPAAVLQQDGDAEEGEVLPEEGSNVVPFPANAGSEDEVETSTSEEEGTEDKEE
jgi:DNA gyrase subunit A